MKDHNKRKALDTRAKKVWYFIYGLFCYSFIHAIIYFFLILYILEQLWPCGNDILNDRLEHNAFFLILSFLGLGQILISILNIRSKKWVQFGWAGIFPLIFTVYFAVIFGPEGLIKSTYYTEFSKEEWKDLDNRTDKMIRYIVNEEILLDLSRKEVKEMLGEPNRISCDEDSCYVYNVKSAWHPIQIDFKNDFAKEVNVQCID